MVGATGAESTLSAYSRANRVAAASPGRSPLGRGECYAPVARAHRMKSTTTPAKVRSAPARMRHVRGSPWKRDAMTIASTG